MAGERALDDILTDWDAEVAKREQAADDRIGIRQELHETFARWATDVAIPTLTAVQESITGRGHSAWVGADHLEWLPSTAPSVSLRVSLRDCRDEFMLVFELQEATSSVQVRAVGPQDRDLGDTQMCQFSELDSERVLAEALQLLDEVPR